MATQDIKPTERQKQPGQLNQEQKDPFDYKSKKPQSTLQPGDTSSGQEQLDDEPQDVEPKQQQ